MRKALLFLVALIGCGGRPTEGVTVHALTSPEAAKDNMAAINLNFVMVGGGSAEVYANGKPLYWSGNAPIPVQGTYGYGGAAIEAGDYLFEVRDHGNTLLSFPATLQANRSNTILFYGAVDAPRFHFFSDEVKAVGQSDPVTLRVINTQTSLAPLDVSYIPPDGGPTQLLRTGLAYGDVFEAVVPNGEGHVEFNGAAGGPLFLGARLTLFPFDDGQGGSSSYAAFMPVNENNLFTSWFFLHTTL